MAVSVDTPIQYLKGVGPKLGDVFRRRGIGTVGDLLEWYPRSYEDQRASASIEDLQPGQFVSISTRVLSVRSMNLGRSRRKMYEVVVGNQTGKISCKYFRVPYKGYFDRFQPYMEVKVTGKVILYRGRIEFHHPDIHVVKEGEVLEDRLIPLYSETEGLKPSKLRNLIGTALSHAQENEEEFAVENFPQWLLKKYELRSRMEALNEIHVPPQESADVFLNFRSPAQERIIFEEFFWLELHMAFKRLGVKKEAAPILGARGLGTRTLRIQALGSQEDDRAWTERVLETLPFQLTGAQQRVLEEIQNDFKKGHPMHRLVQGDVGSGKTMVALLASVIAMESGYQCALMVPTEILAEQHYKNIRRHLEPLGLNVGLLTGSQKASEKREVLERLKSGEVHICVGTHALIQDTVEFHRLGLVVIDEQHRFGVEQRHRLKQKGENPHFLVMTATPIPRTLAMTVYGDLEVSVIDELPPGRTPIVTRVVFPNKRDKVMGFLRDQILKGRQAYIVYPLVEESEKIDLKNAVEEFEKIKAEFPDFKIGLIHGKMKASEKDEVMRSFRDNQFQILVATTVIEVGVDVPNANMMVIEHAERFGLSQLHQLRGRVGRGEYKSYCVLSLGYAVSEESKERVRIMENTSDGFKVSEADLEIRGPGEFLGRRQSGLPGFKMAHLVRDIQILQKARQAAEDLVAKDPGLSLTEHSRVKEVLERKSQDLIG